MAGYKQVIIIRQDLKLPRGKAAAQAAHASVEATLKAHKDVVRKWREQGQKKVAVKVANEQELLLYFQEAKNVGFPASLITDAGKTVIAPGTKTAAAIGPAEEESVDKLTGKLKML